MVNTSVKAIIKGVGVSYAELAEHLSITEAALNSQLDNVELPHERQLGIMATAVKIAKSKKSL
jgi:hypothetical protein